MIVGCPMKHIAGDVWDMLTAADLADDGCWPVAGGWLDQSPSCIAGVRIVQSERAKLELKHGS